MVRKQHATEIGLIAIGLAFTIIGIVLAQLWGKMIEDRFYQELTLSPGTQAYEKWKTTPLPITLNIVFWNWTNPEGIAKEGYKPAFVEMGPYVFNEVHEKVNVTFNENGTVTYRIVKRWYYDEERTNGSLSDEVTSVNVVAASAAYMTKGLTRWVTFPLSLALRTTGQNISWTKNVSQLLFDGFENSIQSISNYIPGLGSTDKFGWFYGRNNTPSKDYYTMDAGINNIQNLGELKLWNFKNTSDYYPNCNREITGFTGEFWPPNRTKQEPLNMYTTDMCRLVKYYYEEESRYDGLSTYVYSGTKETIDNGTLVSENKCYCGMNGCPPSGVFDVTSCQQGAPVFISYPHFYNADPYYANSITGMNPNKENHRFYIELEPRTGIQLDVAARMQINVFLSENRALSLFKNVPEFYIPVLWLETRVSLTEEFTQGLKLMLKLIPLGPSIWYGFSAIGLAIILGVVVYHLHNHPRIKLLKRTFPNEEHIVRKKKRKLISKNENVRESVKFIISEDKTVIND